MAVINLVSKHDFVFSIHMILWRLGFSLWEDNFSLGCQFSMLDNLKIHYWCLSITEQCICEQIPKMGAHKSSPTRQHNGTQILHNQSYVIRQTKTMANIKKFETKKNKNSKHLLADACWRRERSDFLPDRRRICSPTGPRSPTSIAVPHPENLYAPFLNQNK